MHAFITHSSSVMILNQWGCQSLELVDVINASIIIIIIFINQ